MYKHLPKSNLGSQQKLDFDTFKWLFFHGLDYFLMVIDE